MCAMSLNIVKNVNCVIIGDSDSSKHFLFNRIRTNTHKGFLVKNDKKYTDTCRHICEIYHTRELTEQHCVKISFSSTTFHYNIRKFSSKNKKMIPVYIRHCHVIIVCWNVVNNDGFLNLIDWLVMIYTKIKDLGTVVVICGIFNTKFDKMCIPRTKLEKFITKIQKIVTLSGLIYYDVELFNDNALNNLFDKINALTLL